MAMNERIQKLAEQAGIKLPDDSEYNGHIYRNTIEKFARLIVRECAMLANEHLEEIEGVHFGVGRAIKNHFGVE
jgi:hypothetical protein